MSNIKKITITEFKNNQYKQYWDYTNKGKNAFLPKEQLLEVVRHIIYSAYVLNIKEFQTVKTTSLAGTVINIHPHSDASIADSIKGCAAAYKSQPATTLLMAEANMGMVAGDPGAASRYTAISGTPLLSAIYKDIPFIPMEMDAAGYECPKYISVPIPMGLINGTAMIGTGRSAYLAEREAKEVMEWIADMYYSGNWDLPAPEPMSSTGCTTILNEANGCVYYTANIHYGVSIDDINKPGKWDVITELPPTKTADLIVDNIKTKLMTASRDKKYIPMVKDGSGDGRPTWIVVPTGFLNEDNLRKIGLVYSRIEQPFIWDEDLNTMRMSSLNEIAKLWFEDRCNIVKLRLDASRNELHFKNHKIDLIKQYYDNKMKDWDEKRITKFFTEQDSENGNSDAQYVMNLPARTYYPENVKKNLKIKENNLKLIDEISDEIENIGDFVIKEANEVILAQEAFFN